MFFGNGLYLTLSAIGILFYIMATKALPWKIAKSSDSHFNAFLHRAGPYQPFEKLPYQSTKLVGRILDEDPSRRANLEEIMTDPWIKNSEMCSIAHKSTDAESRCQHRHYGGG